MKICNKCKEIKELSEYYIKKNGRPRSYCKICTLKNNKIVRDKSKDKTKEYRKKYRLQNKENIKEKNKIYRDNNKEATKKYTKKYKEKNKERLKKYRTDNSEHIKSLQKLYYENNKEKLKRDTYNYKKERLKRDKMFLLKETFRNTISASIRRFGYTKKSKSFDILCCTFEEFKSYIESKFEHWMSWENYGKYNGEFKYGWDFDHIIPISNANTEEEIIKLNHYTNFQPLDSKINRDIKKNRTDFDISEVVNYNLL